MKIEIETTDREAALLGTAVVILLVGILLGHILTAMLVPGVQSGLGQPIDSDYTERKSVLGVGWDINETCTKWVYVNGTEKINCDDPWRVSWGPGAD